MGHGAQRPIPVFRTHPATLWVASFAAILLQTYLPLRFSLARLFDFPLLITIYFALLRRDKVFGMGLGSILGLLQDTLSHGYIGMFGAANVLVGYLAASASVRFELEHFIPRTALTGVMLVVHSFAILSLQYGLLESPPPFQPLDLASGILVNLALALVMFQGLDRFKQPA